MTSPGSKFIIKSCNKLSIFIIVIIIYLFFNFYLFINFFSCCPPPVRHQRELTKFNGGGNQANDGELFFPRLFNVELPNSACDE